MKHNVTLLSDSMTKNVDTSYIQRKTPAHVIPVPWGGDIGKTVDFIQSNADTMKSQPIIIHTGTNDVVKKSQFTTERHFKRLEGNGYLRHHEYTQLAVCGVILVAKRPACNKGSTIRITSYRYVCENGWTFIDNDFIDNSIVPKRRRDSLEHFRR